MINKTRFPNIYEMRKGKHKVLLTKNLSKGKKVYGEDLISEGGVEYRTFDPNRSKLAASMMKAISQTGFKDDQTILYLGASTGTTPSHVSDIVGDGGKVFCVEFAPRVARELVAVCEDRSNMTIMLADANKPETYANKILEADIVYMDIAQKNQAEIFLKNCKMFLKKGGFGLLALKSRSVDVTKKPKEIYKQIRAQLEREITIVDYRELDPFEKDHAMFVVKKK
ncbi:fibrillarin-like rRNA/tRNA 2'-O-methyltransferase [Nanoarchaeota archaeon]